MKKVGRLLVVALLALVLCQAGASAAAMSNADLMAMFPGARVEKNTVLNVPGQGYFGTEVYVIVPYKEKLSGANLEYDVDFLMSRLIMDYAREQGEAAAKAAMAQFANGSNLFRGGPLDWDDAGTESATIPTTTIVGTTTIDPPQKAAVAGGIVWFQRTTHAAAGSQQVYYRCHYAARVGDFVATLNATVPTDSREQVDEWFRKLIAATGP